MSMTVSDWGNLITDAAIIFYARQQNQIFRQQNQIFASPGQQVMVSKTAPYFSWIRRYWPTMVMIALMIVPGYDIYDRHMHGPATDTASVPWRYGAFLLFIVISIGLVLGRRARIQTSAPTPAENPKELTLAETIFDLAKRYRTAGKEFHHQNPQPPAPPASTAWAAKANGWQRVNFYDDLEKARHQLAAVGLGDSDLSEAIECIPTLDKIERVAQRLRYLASQLADDPNERIVLPDAEFIISERSRRAKLEISVKIDSFSVDEKTVARGKTLKIRYLIECSDDASGNIWLGASFPDKKGKYIFNVHQDKLVSLLKGRHEYDRDLTIPADAPLGSYMLQGNVWRGVLGDSAKSIRLANGGPVEIVVVA